jgi:hypothetical protein
MPETLEALELERTKLYQQLQAVGDFRPGIISVNFRNCGKKKLRLCTQRSPRAWTPISVEYHAVGANCEECEDGVIPKDRELDIDTSFSPGVRRMMGW